MGEIIRHPHHVYITIPNPRSSKDISINSRLKDNLNTVQNSSMLSEQEPLKNKS